MHLKQTLPKPFKSKGNAQDLQNNILNKTKYILENSVEMKQWQQNNSEISPKVYNSLPETWPRSIPVDAMKKTSGTGEDSDSAKGNVDLGNS